MRWYWGFMCISLFISNVQHIFIYLLATCMSSLDKYLFKSFIHFQISLVLLLSLNWPCNFFFFWLHHTACRPPVPWPGIKPASPALEEWRLNQWTAREVPIHVILYGSISLCNFCPCPPLLSFSKACSLLELWCVISVFI